MPNSTTHSKTGHACSQEKVFKDIWMNTSSQTRPNICGCVSFIFVVFFSVVYKVRDKGTITAASKHLYSLPCEAKSPVCLFIYLRSNLLIFPP